MPVPSFGQPPSVLAQLDDHGKLVNLTTRLRGTVYSFYRSCTLEQRSDYKLLVAELKTRFTPVQLTAVQSQLFLDRHQGPMESVDTYAQELRKLFARAYTSASRGGTEAEATGRAVLANQFITGLRPELKIKVMGTEGNLDQLLVKARFEEAKRRELNVAKGPSTFQPRKTGKNSFVPTGKEQSKSYTPPENERLHRWLAVL